MSAVVEQAVSWALAIAADDSHGYDQGSRWGADYDCSSLVISAFEQAGVPVKSGGATYTGNMKRVFLKNGFTDVTASCNLATAAGMQRGDVLLNEVKHTALYLGGNRIVHARGNENGGALGGKTGDQTGAEIRTQAYYNSPWDCVLRYTGDAPAAAGGQSSVSFADSSFQKELGGGSATRSCEVMLPVLRKGAKSEAVRAMQLLLNGRGCSVGSCGADGSFGSATLAALRKYQGSAGLEVDGVCGPRTWEKLIGG